MEVDVERCPFRPQQQKQAHHVSSDFVAHLMLKNIGARGSRQGEIKFLAPKIYLLVNTHTPTQNAILKNTLHQNVHTHAQGYSRSLRSQTNFLRPCYPNSTVPHQVGSKSKNGARAGLTDGDGDDLFTASFRLSRVYRVKTTDLGYVTGLPCGDDSEEVEVSLVQVGNGVGTGLNFTVKVGCIVASLSCLRLYR
jgi:hypothetical protein